MCDVRKGKSITQKQAKEGNIKVVAGGIDFAYYHNEANREANTITISASGANAGFVNFWREEIFASDCTTLKAKTDIETYYVYYFLKSIQEQIFNLARGSAQPHVYPDDIKEIIISVPPLAKQQEIVSEIEHYEAEIEKLEGIMKQSAEKKQAILEKYL